MNDLLPEADFRLFAVTVRYPQALAQQRTMRRISDGVFEVDHFTGAIRIVVVHQLPQREQNAMLLLFSARNDLVEYGGEHYRPRSKETSTFLRQLYERYQQEGMPMPFTAEEFIREATDQIIKSAPIEKRLEGLTPEQLLAGLSQEERQELLRLLQADKPPPASDQS